MAEPSWQPEHDAEGIDAMEDARLVERVLHGDAAAFGELVSRHMRSAFAIAWRILEHREDAEDTVQDAFIRALEGIRSLDTGRGFRPWFLRIVVNQALNARRSRSVRATEPMPPDVVATTQSPERAAERAALRTELRSALAGLPKRQRLIVQLADLEGLNSSEIAEILDVPAGTVRWHLHQARRTLRTVLAPVKEDG
jgi:RNA polymerase sigma-70 factor, ECF subfamily